MALLLADPSSNFDVLSLASISEKASWPELFALLYAHAPSAHILFVLIVRASPAWHTNARRARKRVRRRLHQTGTVATAQDLAAYRRLREHHGSQPPSKARTCVCCRTENAVYSRKCSNFECRFSGGPPEAWEQKHGKEKRKDKHHFSKHTWHCADCGEENSSRRSSCSCGAKPPQPEASPSVAQPNKRPGSQRQNFAEAVAQERRRVQATLPVSRSPTVRRPMSRSTRIPIRTGTRATPRRLPTGSKTWTPSLGSFTRAPRTRAWLSFWRR